MINNSNPQTGPRKQTSTIDKQTTPTSPTRFRYPLSPHNESSTTFWNKDDHYTWIDENTPHKPTPKLPLPRPDDEAILSKLNKARKAFVQEREQMAMDLVRAIDEKVMEGKLAASTATTGGVKLVWSTRLRTAAGRAHWIRTKGTKDGINKQHDLKIELSTKIITDEGILSSKLNQKNSAIH
jgi:SprT-like family